LQHSFSSSIRDSVPQEASREEAVAYSGEAIEYEAPRLSEGLDDSANISIVLDLKLVRYELRQPERYAMRAEITWSWTAVLSNVRELWCAHGAASRLSLRFRDGNP
jgi:hypothetical protein